VQRKIIIARSILALHAGIFCEKLRCLTHDWSDGQRNLLANATQPTVTAHSLYDERCGRSSDIQLRKLEVINIMMSVATCTWLLRAVEYANLGPGQRVARFKKEKLVRVLYSGCNSYAPTVAMAEKTHGVENRRRFSPVFNPVCFQPKASARCVAAGLSKLCEPFQKLKATRRSLYNARFCGETIWDNSIWKVYRDNYSSRTCCGARHSPSNWATHSRRSVSVYTVWQTQVSGNSFEHGRSRVAVPSRAHNLPRP